MYTLYGEARASSILVGFSLSRPTPRSLPTLLLYQRAWTGSAHHVMLCASATPRHLSRGCTTRSPRLAMHAHTPPIPPPPPHPHSCSRAASQHTGDGGRGTARHATARHWAYGHARIIAHTHPHVPTGHRQHDGCTMGVVRWRPLARWDGRWPRFAASHTHNPHNHTTVVTTHACLLAAATPGHTVPRRAHFLPSQSSARNRPSPCTWRRLGAILLATP